METAASLSNDSQRAFDIYSELNSYVDESFNCSEDEEHVAQGSLPSLRALVDTLRMVHEVFVHCECPLPPVRPCTYHIPRQHPAYCTALQQHLTDVYTNVYNLNRTVPASSRLPSDVSTFPLSDSARRAQATLTVLCHTKLVARRLTDAQVWTSSPSPATTPAE